MPQIKQELVAVNLINELQAKVELLSGWEGGESHINDHAFNELSKHNALIYNKVKRTFAQNEFYKKEIERLQGIVAQLQESNWFKKYSPDEDYHKRQYITRAMKEKRQDVKLCPCGELIVNKRNYFAEHQKRDKCVSSRMRIKYDKGKIIVRPLNRLLTMNSKMNELYNDPPDKYNPYGMYCLAFLMKRKYWRRVFYNMYEYQSDSD